MNNQLVLQMFYMKIYMYSHLLLTSCRLPLLFTNDEFNHLSHGIKSHLACTFRIDQISYVFAAVALTFVDTPPSSDAVGLLIIWFTGLSTSDSSTVKGIYLIGTYLRCLEIMLNGCMHTFIERTDGLHFFEVSCVYIIYIYSTIRFSV